MNCADLRCIFARGHRVVVIQAKPRATLHWMYNLRSLKKKVYAIQNDKGASKNCCHEACSRCASTIRTLWQSNGIDQRPAAPRAMHPSPDAVPRRMPRVLKTITFLCFSPCLSLLRPPSSTAICAPLTSEQATNTTTPSRPSPGTITTSPPQITDSPLPLDPKPKCQPAPPVSPSP